VTQPNEPSDPWATPPDTPSQRSSQPVPSPPAPPPPYAPPPSGQPPVYGQPPAYGQPPVYGPPPVYGQPPYAPQGYYQQPPSTNGFAIASMILGILWLYWVGSILALIFGYVARGQIRAGNQTGDGMAIAGIVLGWIGVGVLALLILLGIAAGAGAFA
jgi:uncharacterized protein DUF4190